MPEFQFPELNLTLYFQGVGIILTALASVGRLSSLLTVPNHSPAVVVGCFLEVPKPSPRGWVLNVSFVAVERMAWMRF